MISVGIFEYVFTGMGEGEPLLDDEIFIVSNLICQFYIIKVSTNVIFSIGGQIFSKFLAEFRK